MQRLLKARIAASQLLNNTDLEVEKAQREYEESKQIKQEVEVKKDDSAIAVFKPANLVP